MAHHSQNVNKVLSVLLHFFSNPTGVIVTYLVILMQFKLTLPARVGDASGNIHDPSFVEKI